MFVTGSSRLARAALIALCLQLGCSSGKTSGGSDVRRDAPADGGIRFGDGGDAPRADDDARRPSDGPRDAREDRAGDAAAADVPVLDSGAGGGDSGDSGADSSVDSVPRLDGAAPACVWVDVAECSTGQKIADYCPAGRTAQRLRRCDDSVFSGPNFQSYIITYDLCSCAWITQQCGSGCVVWKAVECCL